MKEDTKEKKSKLFNLLNIDSLIDSVLQYFEKRIELVKIEIKEEAAVVGAKLAITMVLSFLMLFFLLFLSIMVGMFLNEYLDSQYLGYAYVTGFYIFLIILIQLLRKFGDLDSRIEAMIYELLTSNKKKEVRDEQE
jgi:uncharacterized membrane protein YqjE